MDAECFNRIIFEYSDAGQEMQHAPEVLEKAYVDYRDSVRKIKQSNYYIVVGPKGSGKTALANRVRLRAQVQADQFVEIDDLENYDYKQLVKIGKKKVNTVTVWKLLLYVRLLSIVTQDESIRVKVPQLDRILTELMKIGIIHSSSPTELTNIVVRKGGFAKLASAIDIGLGYSIEETYSRKSPDALIGTIQHIFKTYINGENTYYLFIDGIDSVVYNNRDYRHDIANLVKATKSINEYMLKLKLNIKIILLMRSEIIYQLPDPNLNKRINDNAIMLFWHDMPRDPFKGGLLQIISMRARLAGCKKELRQLWRDWFPSKIDGRRTERFFLDHTRYLPRDIIMLFNQFKHIGATPKYSREHILSAMSRYSEWFLRELYDATSNIIDDVVRDKLISILSELGKEFTAEQFKEKVINRVRTEIEIDTEYILEYLYRTSWIGNVWMEGNMKKYEWAHRKQSSHTRFRLDRKYVLHQGLWKEMNLI